MVRPPFCGKVPCCRKRLIFTDCSTIHIPFIRNVLKSHIWDQLPPRVQVIYTYQFDSRCAAHKIFPLLFPLWG